MVVQTVKAEEQAAIREIWQQGFELKFSPGPYTPWLWTGLVLEVLDNGVLDVLVDFEHTGKAGEEPGWYAGEVEWSGAKWVMRDGFPNQLCCPPPPEFSRADVIEFLYKKTLDAAVRQEINGAPRPVLLIENRDRESGEYQGPCLAVHVDGEVLITGGPGVRIEVLGPATARTVPFDRQAILREREESQAAGGDR
ncbi:MAG: hypothetical protein ACE15F_24600 [bacterium]